MWGLALWLLQPDLEWIEPLANHNMRRSYKLRFQHRIDHENDEFILCLVPTYPIPYA
jgi:hypothetical protein